MDQGASSSLASAGRTAVLPSRGELTELFGLFLTGRPVILVLNFYLSKSGGMETVKSVHLGFS